MTTLLSPSVRRVVVQFAAVVALLFAGVLGFLLLAALRAPAERKGAVALGYPVGTMAVARGEFRERQVAFGTARALHSARLTMRVAGSVAWVRPGLRPGVAVAEGEELIRLDDRTYAAEAARQEALLEAAAAELDRQRVALAAWDQKLLIAERDFELASANYERARDLIARTVISQREYDQAELTWKTSERQLVDTRQTRDEQKVRVAAQQATVRQGDAALARARADLADTVLRAPFAGIVEAVNIEVGESIGVAAMMAGQPLLVIVATDRIEVPLAVAGRFTADLALGTPVSLEMTSRPERTWTGTIARIAPSIDARDRTIEVYVEVTNDPAAPETALLPGTFLAAAFDGRAHPDALVIPRKAMIDGLVFVAEPREGDPAGGHVVRERRPVVASASGGSLLLASGLEPGEQLVLTNLDVLYDGAPVRLTGAAR